MTLELIQRKNVRGDFFKKREKSKMILTFSAHILTSGN